MNDVRGELLARQLELNHYATRTNLADLSHEDSLRQPAPGGNCANWVLGHMLATRDTLLAVLDEPPACPPAVKERYGRGSRPITTPAEAHPWDELLAAFEVSQKRLLARLRSLDPEALGRTLEGGGGFLVLQCHKLALIFVQIAEDQ
jgi:hypothetical protein